MANDCSVLNVYCCLIACKACQIAIVSIYRSPSVCVKSAFEDLRLVLQGLLPHVNLFVIVGDVNINLLSTSCDKENHSNLLSDFYLQQHVCQPTCVTENSATLFDHVITSKDIPVSSLQQTCGLSDHKVQVANFELRTVRPLPSIRHI